MLFEFSTSFGTLPSRGDATQLEAQRKARAMAPNGQGLADDADNWYCRPELAGKREVSSAASLLCLARRTPPLRRRTGGYRRSTLHILGVTRRNLVVRHWHADNWSGYPLDWNKRPRASVATRVEPCAVLECVVAAPVHKEIELDARGVRDRTVGDDDNARRRRQYDSWRRWDWDADIDPHVHFTSNRFSERKTDGYQREYQREQCSIDHGRPPGPSQH